MSADDTIERCLAGRISPEVALARLVLAGLSPEEIACRLHADLRNQDQPAPVLADDHYGRERATALTRLLAEQRDGLERLTRMVAVSGLDHGVAASSPDAALERTRAAFDSAVACSPEASVAAYSLGDPAILDAATTELVDWLAGEGLIGPDRDVLDLGCGIGRVAAALAPRCRSVLGVDISPGMIAEARRRHVFPNVRFAVTDGRDLSVVVRMLSEQTHGNAVIGRRTGHHFPSASEGVDARVKPGHDGVGGPAFPLEASFDLVLAVDSFPYLMQAGLAIAERHVADAARLLRKDGALVILNLSYRGDPARDREDVMGWASTHGFRLVRNGETPFAMWDGAAFVFSVIPRAGSDPETGAAAPFAAVRTTAAAGRFRRSRPGP